MLVLLERQPVGVVTALGIGGGHGAEHGSEHADEKGEQPAEMPDDEDGDAAHEESLNR